MKQALFRYVVTHNALIARFDIIKRSMLSTSFEHRPNANELNVEAELFTEAGTEIEIATGIESESVIETGIGIEIGTGNETAIAVDEGRKVHGIKVLEGKD